MVTDEERRAAIASDTEISVEQSQETSETAEPHAITMVNYIGVYDIETEGGKDALSSLHAALAKIFGRQPEDA